MKIKNMKYISIIILSLSLLGCKNEVFSDEKSKPKDILKIDKKKTSYTNDELNYKHVCNTNLGSHKFIFNEVEYLYSLPDTTSTIKEKVNFGQFRYHIKEMISYNNQFWYSLSNGSFIKSNAFQDYYMGSGDFAYVGKVINIKVPYEDEPDRYYWLKKFVLKKINRTTNEVIDQFISSHLLKNYTIKKLYGNSLKNVDALFHIQSDLDECPGGFHEEFIIDNNGKFISLLVNQEGGMDGDEYYEIEENEVYIPIKVSKTKTVLAPEGRFDRILKDDLSLNIFDYKSSIGVPIEELIVVRKRTSNSKNDNLKIKEYFYRWNGKELKLLN